MSLVQWRKYINLAIVLVYFFFPSLVLLLDHPETQCNDDMVCPSLAEMFSCLSPLLKIWCIVIHAAFPWATESEALDVTLALVAKTVRPP
jgi:hypothetical protein